MRVLHLSTFDIRGGAARGTYWLHQALERRGVESRMLVGRKYGSDASVSEPPRPLNRVVNALRGRLDTLPLRRYRPTGESFWTLGWLPDRIDSAIDALDPEIVHLHWTGGGFLSIESLARLKRPVVWTLRDMWAFTGGCHYTAGCERYALACGRCPQLRSDREADLSRRLWRLKQSSWRDVDLWLVPISSWLADCLERSGLFPDTPVEVIPNGIDTGAFRPTDRAEAKAAWDLPADRRHILFGAVDATDDVRKGFHHMVEAARLLARQCWSKRAELVVFGGEAPSDLADCGLPIRSVGRVDDDAALARLYSASDVMVVPSEQEAFGKTLVEAMACGTPVVAFASGGPLDIVEHGRSGYLAGLGKVEELARGIAWCLEDPARNAALGRSARVRAEREFEIEAVAGRYQSLYHQILSRAP
ncbi:Glycosyltransferase involved in cell wall bisynthesis [Tistlia consotensis]|uniref:Glycosyltransferase involved in cell wall bisynthesis n=1 Tax=Tistlia consotensis USBA 355 TaxID=560819 RepID=A0A1Y6CFN2_9PROT|nr:glycosyltransferase family 4 protein [Tistlia consotensis]SMF58975.1 Glycosyltransferase involved in cell wall bisynthesis [Tistlia consotensis USBA 355]SNR64062.1 Glycosyltransferase involved in cell wall bisynthesis [Tistlia consotensis]